MRGNGSSGNGTQRLLHFPLVAFDQIGLTTDRRYLVKNLIPKEALIVVWGPPKCGKSFFVSDIAFHISLGWPYRDRRVEPGTVVYITCEGQSGFPARVAAFRQERMSEEIDPPPFHLLPTRLDLVGEIDVLIHDIIEQLGGPHCSLIVIDTLNRSLAGSESKDEDMSAYVQACDKLREMFHCSVVVMHHCGINGERPRGHTSLSGAADAQIAIKRNEQNQIIATIEYMKDGPEGDEFASTLLTIAVGFDEDGEEITSCVIEPVESHIPQAVSKAKKTKTATTAGGKIAADTLRKTIAEAGHSPPASNHIPQSATVVSLVMWRNYHYLALGDDMPAATKRQDFYRARQSLQAAGIIKIHGDYVWMV